jgi:hypothetical protein
MASFGGAEVAFGGGEIIEAAFGGGELERLFGGSEVEVGVEA